MRYILFLLMVAGFMVSFAQETAEKSVVPGINDTWKSDEIAPLVDRLESESREIYVHREELVTLLNIAPGSRVADVGAGSGFMSFLFAREVGPQGRVFAVDINPKMMEKVAAEAASLGVGNLETVVCPETSVGLPDSSVDLIFICDTYHHFEFPMTVLATIHKALKPGGQLIIVDFERNQDSSEWIQNHVRAGREVFSAEIQSAGFKLIAQEPAPFFHENYILRFQRQDKE